MAGRSPDAAVLSTFELTLNRPAIFEPSLYFGDISLDAFARLGTGTQPWQSFEEARAFVADGNLPEARATLESIELAPGIESRVRVQAWHSLREAGGRPPPSVHNDVLGGLVQV